MIHCPLATRQDAPEQLLRLSCELWGRVKTKRIKWGIEGRCEDCGKIVQHTDSDLQSDACDLWYHTKCQKLSDDIMFEFLNKN